MKNKKSKHPYHSVHHVTHHQKIERFFRHRAILSFVLFAMGISVVKYQSHFLAVIQHIQSEGRTETVQKFEQHHETIRMPVDYGRNRLNSIAGE